MPSFIRKINLIKCTMEVIKPAGLVPPTGSAWGGVAVGAAAASSPAAVSMLQALGSTLVLCLVGLLLICCSLSPPLWSPCPFPTAERRAAQGSVPGLLFPPPCCLCSWLSLSPRAPGSHICLCRLLTLSLGCPTLRACEKPHHFSISLFK